MTDETTKIIEALTPLVEKAGKLAREKQRTLSPSDRTYKDDESVVTEADEMVERFLVERIARLVPSANLLTEEAEHDYDPKKPLSFAIDPIDGTDVYSQGMPGWCVSVGLLDRALVPIGGVIYAPCLDLLVATSDNGPVTLNRSPLAAPGPAHPISVRSNLMVTSHIHKTVDLSGYVGKIRGIGSAALHLIYHLIYPPVIGALEGPGIHIWDVAAAHAINRAQGEDLAYLNGRPIDYAPMTGGGPGADVVVSGRPSTVQALRHMLHRLPSRPTG